MFPFLSVLCAILGVLMLFLLAIVGRRVIAAEDALAAAGGARAALERRLRSSALPEERFRRLDDELRELQRRLDEQIRRFRELQRLSIRLHEAIAAKEDEAELASSPAAVRSTGTRLAAAERVALVPDPKRQVTKEPILIEVRPQAFLVHPEKTEYSLAQLAAADSPLAKFLRDAYERRDRQYLLLLVAPNGVTAYDQLRAYLRGKYAQAPAPEGTTLRSRSFDLGKEPFLEDWLLVGLSDGPEREATEP